MMHHETNGTPQSVSFISAEHHGRAQAVLRLIAGPTWAITNSGFQPPCINRRDFEEVDHGYWVGSVLKAKSRERDEGGTIISLELCLGNYGGQSEVGIHLRNTVGSKWSCKPVTRTGNAYVLEIGNNVPESRLPSIANTIVGCWVIRGFGHQGTPGNSQRIMPYGPEPNPSGNHRSKKRKTRRYRSREVMGQPAIPSARRLLHLY